MIFMQKWCWFHFPKYYSFILLLFFTGLEARARSQHLLPATAAGSRDRSTGAEDAGAALLPVSKELKHFG